MIETEGLSKYYGDFIAVEDCAIANIRALKSNSSGYFLNVGTGKDITIKDLADKISTILNYQGNIQLKFCSFHSFLSSKI